MGLSQREGEMIDGGREPRYQRNAELGGGERFKAHSKHAHESSPGPAARYEMASSR